MRVEHMPSLGQALYVFSVVGWVAGRERAFDIINDIGKKKIVPKFIWFLGRHHFTVVQFFSYIKSQ